MRADAAVGRGRRGVGEHGAACDEHLRAGRLVPLFPDWTPDSYTVYAVYPHRQFLPSKVRSFIDFLVARFGPEPYWDSDNGQTMSLNR